MATKKKMLQAASGSASGAGLDVDEVFSTYLYEGTGSAQTINNGIDLAGEGGIVWTKIRYPSGDHTLMDSGFGAGTRLLPNQSNALLTGEGCSTSFNSNGITLGGDSSVSNNGRDFSSWTFRKAPKFFDVVTYSGNSTSGRTISHNLDAEVGMMIIKKTNSSTDSNWAVYHRKTIPNDPAEMSTLLNSTAAAFRQQQHFNDTEPTSTQFTLGNSTTTNGSGNTYVAYLFAHNDGDGGFGPDADQDIIKCGSYTGDGTDQSIELGFEPQWVMIKNTSSGSTYSDWVIFDNMRKLDASGSGNAPLMANLSDSEGGAYASSSYNLVQPTPTGMIVEGTSGPLAVGTNGDNYIYMAIRRGPLAPPESATEVFAMDTQGSSAPYFDSGFPVDMAFYRPTSSDHTQIVSRITGDKRLYTNLTSSEGSSSGHQWDYMDGWYGSAINNNQSWMWKRAPNYFDVVAYTGDGVAGRTVSHNLGVAPEMMWVKSRGNAEDWYVYHKDLGNGSIVILNTNSSVYNGMSNVWNNTSPTSSVFTVGTNGKVNLSGDTYITYLFATLGGISKVGSVSHSGTTNVDCGFTSGSRFVLLKRTDASGDWYFWDSLRGIVSGNDPYLLLNTNAAQEINTDYIDPLSSGFTITSNFTAGDYIFYAIS